jgi:hypothetical protein
MMRQAHQLERLRRKFRADRVDALRRQALDFDEVDVARIESVLRQALSAEHQMKGNGGLCALPRGRFDRTGDAFATRAKEVQ